MLHQLPGYIFCVPVSVQTSNHCSDNRALEDGWLVTGDINSHTLFREIREKPSKQQTIQAKSFFERWRYILTIRNYIENTFRDIQ